MMGRRLAIWTVAIIFAAFTLLARMPARAGTVDCDDFATIAEAYDFFYANGGPDYDPYDLDGDGDGRVCEWGVGGTDTGSGAGTSNDYYVPDDQYPDLSDDPEIYGQGDGEPTIDDLTNLLEWTFKILIPIWIVYGLATGCCYLVTGETLGQRSDRKDSERANAAATTKTGMGRDASSERLA